MSPNGGPGRDGKPAHTGGLAESGSTHPGRGTYFFLSYAHSIPTPGNSDADPWVTKFYRNLCTEVECLARPQRDLDIGFFDGLVDQRPDWKVVLSAALGGAEVFVPLYSPGYLTRSWPMSERESFRRRLAAVRHGQVLSAELRRHIVPVLWTPVPRWDRPPEVAEAIELGAGVSAYVENGLRALCMLSIYEHHYKDMVRIVAGRIVEVAEGSPLGPSPAPSLDEVVEPSRSGPSFVVAVISPTEKDKAPGLPRGRYGLGSREWRPFPDDQDVPIAQYASYVAERLGLPTRIVDFTTETSAFDSSPGVLLVDPWVMAVAGGEMILSAARERLREWVTPLVVVNPSDSDATALCVATVDMLGTPGGPQVSRAGGVEELVSMLPSLVIKVRRRYLRSALVRPPIGTYPPRPRLVRYDFP